MTRTIPRLAIATDLRCNAGTLLGYLAGEGNTPHTFDDTRAFQGQESLHFAIAASAANASLIQEGRIAQVWWSDTVYDEWIIGPITKTRGKGSVYDVQCRPISYRLTDCGFVKTDIVPSDNKPVLDDGVAQTSVTALLTDKIINNPNVNTLLPWLALGTITPTALIDLDWSNATPQAIILAAVDAVQSAASISYDYRLVRNGSTSYDITITAAT